MKANSYILKKEVTVEELVNKGFKFSKSNDKEMFYYIPLVCGMELHFNIQVSPDIKFDDFESLEVIDGAFCQPYTPFYGDNYKKNISGFKSLESVIDSYNKEMDSMELFEICKEDDFYVSKK